MVDALKAALADASGVVVVYTDLTRLSFWKSSKEATIKAHADAILEAVGDRTLVFPTFNYDWCQTGLYDPQNDPCQVGQLNEYMRVQHGIRRTHTPIFNFTVVRSVGTEMPRKASADPFGPDSELKWLIKNEATVLAYGARLRHASACHVNERDAYVPYRDFKAFEGRIIDYGVLQLKYHVRDPDVTYDWDGLEAMLDPLFTTYDINGPVKVGRADQVYNRIAEALEADKYALVEQKDD